MLAHEAWLGAASRRPSRRGAAASCGARNARPAERLLPVFDWHAGRTLEQLRAASRPSAWSRWWRPPSRPRARWAGCTGRRGAPRHQAGATCTWATTASGACWTWAWRSRAASPGRRAQPACRHAQLHEPRAVGRRAVPADAASDLYRARRHAVPVAHRPAAVRRDRALPARALPARSQAAVAAAPRRADLAGPRAAEGGRARPRGCASRPPRKWCWRWSAAPRGRCRAARHAPVQRDPTAACGRSRWASRCCSTHCCVYWLLFLPR